MFTLHVCNLQENREQEELTDETSLYEGKGRKKEYGNRIDHNLLEHAQFTLDYDVTLQVRMRNNAPIISISINNNY